MNWKKFLKPDWRKIILTIILSLLLIAFIPQYAQYIHELTCLREMMSGKCISRFEFNLDIFSLFSIVVISYLLSSLIIWIYDKVKKK